MGPSRRGGWGGWVSGCVWVGVGVRVAQACLGPQHEQLVAAAEACLSGVRARAAGLQPFGAQVRGRSRDQR